MRVLSLSRFIPKILNHFIKLFKMLFLTSHMRKLKRCCLEVDGVQWGFSSQSVDRLLVIQGY